MPRIYQYLALSVVAWLSLANTDQSNRPQQRPRHQENTSSSAATRPQRAGSVDQPERGCVGTTKPQISCEAISAQAAIDQSRFSGYQTAFGGLTLLAAVAAALFAWRAAVETRRSAIAAESSLSYARDTGNIQLQAYVIPKHASIERQDGDVYKIVCSILNTGVIPARNIEANIMATLVPMPISAFKPQFDDSPILIKRVAPSPENYTKIFVGINITDYEFEKIKNAELYILCRVYAEYRPLPHLDVEREELEMTFASPDVKNMSFRTLRLG